MHSILFDYLIHFCSFYIPLNVVQTPYQTLLNHMHKGVQKNTGIIQGEGGKCSSFVIEFLCRLSFPFYFRIQK